jgi:peptidoglycan/LPS O-acetylase OafA/YrhL
MRLCGEHPERMPLITVRAAPAVAFAGALATLVLRGEINLPQETYATMSALLFSLLFGLVFTYHSKDCDQVQIALAVGLPLMTASIVALGASAGPPTSPEAAIFAIAVICAGFVAGMVGLLLLILWRRPRASRGR